ncbi:MAG: hypothetical protein Q8K78_12245 [Planctomycetaceae bacterium]|nr:hypothetical protein [Planctomycetaceae bacterium]
MTDDRLSRGRIWLVVTVLQCLAGIGLPSVLDAAEKRADPVKPVITPAPATTHITAPLDAEGYVDFLAALNQHLGRGVAPSENAAIPILEAIGLADGNVEATNLLRAELGMPPWSPGMMDLVTIGNLVNEKTAGFKDNGVVTNSEKLEAESKRIFDQNGAASERPWKEADFPEMAELLKRNEGPLKRVAEGVLRPKYYRPMVKREPTDTLIAILLPDIQESREFARQLAMRAMLHLGHGRTQEAQNDLLTMHRLGAHISHGATLIEGLVGVAIDTIATVADNRWAAHPQVTPVQIAAYRQQLTTLPTVGNFAEQLDVCERFAGLDVTQAIARGRLTTTSVMNEQLNTEESGVQLRPERFLESLIGLSVDWTVAMQTLNRQYDEMAAMSKNTDPRSRDRGLMAIDAQLRVQKAESASFKGVVSNVLGGNKGRGKNMGNTLGQLLVPAVVQVFEAENRVRMRRLTLITGFAILEYRAANEACPASLKDLVPEYLPAVPQDVYTGEPLKYTTDGANFRVYAIGKNRQDDGGKTFTANQPWDDVGFSMPPQQ